MRHSHQPFARVLTTSGCLCVQVRDLERELLTLRREEQQLVKQIKDAAAKNNVAGAKVLAKQLVRLR